MEAELPERDVGWGPSGNRFRAGTAAYLGRGRRCHPARRPPRPQPHRLAPASALERLPAPPPHAPAAETSLIARVPGPPAPAGPPISRRRRWTGPAPASSPATPVAVAPQPGFPQPGPCSWPAHLHLFAEVARPRHCRRPGATAAAAMPAAPASRHGAAPGPALGSPSVGLSVSRSCLPQRHPRRLLQSTGRFGQTSTWLLVRTRRSDHRNTILPARPPVPPPPPPLNSSNGSSPAEPRARAAAILPPWWAASCDVERGRDAVTNSPASQSSVPHRPERPRPPSWKREDGRWCAPCRQRSAWAAGNADNYFNF